MSFQRIKRPFGESPLERLRALTQFEFYHRYRQGEINQSEYFQALTALEEDRTVRHIQRKMMEQNYHLNGVAWDWDSVVEWLQENWLSILKMVLTIVLLFAEESPENGEQT